MMSVQSEADYLRRAMLAGARDFLTKPISGEELSGTVRSVYERRPQFAVAPMSSDATEKGKRALSTTHRAHVIVVYSPQWGPGTTTIATNLSDSLMRAST